MHIYGALGGDRVKMWNITTEWLEYNDEAFNSLRLGEMGLSSVRYQALTWTNANLLSNGPSGTHFSEIFIEIQTFSLMKMHLKMLTAKWGQDKMTTLSNTFSWMKMLEFRLRFHWSLLSRVQLTVFQHWFRQWLGAGQATSHYLNQWWLVYWRIYASLSLNELIAPVITGHIPRRPGV